MVRRLVDPVLGQLRRPHGSLAPLTARMLNLANRPINHWTIRALELSGEEQVLDVGFGGGVGLGLALGRLGSGRATGIDISQEMVQRAGVAFRDAVAIGRLQVVCASVDAIPFPNASFDRAYSVNTVFFWPDPAAAVAELHRVIRAGGRLVIAAPRAGFLLARSVGIAPHTGVAEIGATRRLIQNAGFAEVRVSGRMGASLIVAAR